MGTSAFGAGCQESSEGRSVAGVSVEKRLGRMWVPKSDRRMVAARETQLELDWDWLLVQEMVSLRIDSERLWDPRLDLRMVCNSVRMSDRLWVPWVVQDLALTGA
eukprot:12578140-Ditylum_brightwellii.AAC.1